MNPCRNGKGLIVLKNLKNSTPIRPVYNIFSGREFY